MQSNYTRLLAGLCTLVAAMVVAESACAADACDPVYEATIKALQTPNHAYLTMIHSDGEMANSNTFKRLTGKAMYASKTETSETIFDGKTAYLLYHGKWMRSPMQPKDVLNDAQEKAKAHAATCTLVGAQSIDGQAATLYKVHNRETDTDEQVWVSNSSGLPVHVKSMDASGNGDEMRYEYTNVHAPAGVQ